MILMCRLFQVCCIAVAALAIGAAVFTEVWWLLLAAVAFGAMTVPFGAAIADEREDAAREERIRRNLAREWSR